MGYISALEGVKTVYIVALNYCPEEKAKGFLHSIDLIGIFIHTFLKLK